MRTHRTGTQPLVGQLLLAEVGTDSITLDCLLSRAGLGTATPVTLKAAWPTQPDRSGAARPSCVAQIGEVVQEWAETGAEIQVQVREGPRGPMVEIFTASVSVVLEPEE